MENNERNSKARQILETIHGPALSKTESDQAAKAINDRFMSEVAFQRRHDRTMRDINRPVNEALARQLGVSTDKARAEMEAFARNLSPLKAPETPSFDSMLLPGSIIAVYGPPYHFGTEHRPNGTEAWGRADIGQIHVRAQAFGGDPNAASAQVGQWFQPITNGIVRFRTAIHYSFQWWCSSLFYTAHTRAFVGVFIFENTRGVQKLTVDARRQLWSNGTSWTQSHSDAGDSHEFFDIPFFANTQSAYFLGVWCGCSVDADSGFGGFGAASADILGNVPLIVVKTS